MPVVVAIRKPLRSTDKTIDPNQKAVDALPFNSGDWRIRGTPGLFVRCRMKRKTYRLERRVDGHLVKHTLGPLSLKQAREKAMTIWSGLKPKPAAHEVATFGAVLEEYIEDQELSPVTAENYRYNARRYLAGWTGRGFADIGKDRAGVRWLVRHVTKTY